MDVIPHSHLGTPDNPSPAAHDAVAVWAADEAAQFGHDDLAYSARELAAVYGDQVRAQRAMLLAYEHDRCLGLANVELPLADNRHMIAVDFRLRPEAHGEGVMDALFAAIGNHADDDRSTLLCWTPPTRLSDTGLTPKTGTGTLPRTPSNDWFAARGFALEQVELVSTLRVADVVERANEVAAKSPEYDVVSWVGPTPERWREAMALQRASMSTDVPLGGIDMEPEVWDIARLQEFEAVERAMGRSMVWTIAVERATGEVAAHTLIVCPEAGRTDVGFQGDTLVRPAHQGKRLGLRVKAANLRQLAAAHPGVERVYTWNAGENQWMLAINKQLGFAPAAAVGCWQRGVDKRAD